MFAISLLLYTAALLLITPAPASLKARKPGFFENLRAIKASLVTGWLILGLFWLSSDFAFTEINPDLANTLALHGGLSPQPYWLIRAVTHIFLHFNLLHVLANVSLLGLTSVYERRVGSRRFLMVLLIASLGSILSALFYGPEYQLMGISGGLFGLAAAYFTDHKALTIKEWLQAIAFFAVLTTMIGFTQNSKALPGTELNAHIDHISHILGAISAIIYCRFKAIA